MTKWSVAVFGTLLVCSAPDAAAQRTVEYIHTDALGSVVAITDASGNIVERRDYEPFGLDLAGIKDGPGYTGHVSDAATGLSYMQQRYYDPQIGRFLSVDPVTAYGGDVRHFNRYAYAYNNPYKFFDPDGRLGCTGSRITSTCENGGVPGLRTSARSSLDTGKNKQSGAPKNAGERGLNVNWKGMGKAVEVKVGPALAAQVGARLGPFKAKVGPEASFGFGANATGEANFYSETDFNLVTLSAGQHSVGLGKLQGTKDTFFKPGEGIGTDIQPYKESTIGYSYGQGSQSNWTISAELGIPGGAAQMSVDFKQIWDSVNYED